MSEDRELLELAARAAGLSTQDELFDVKLGVCHEIDTVSGDCDYWNPLTDDGDALRLAAKLEIDIDFHVNVEAVAWGKWADGEQRHVFQERGLSLDATRRAIVRAAAEIGRQITD